MYNLNLIVLQFQTKNHTSPTSSKKTSFTLFTWQGCYFRCCQRCVSF